MEVRGRCLIFQVADNPLNFRKLSWALHQRNRSKSLRATDRVLFQVVGRPICQAHALDPAIAALDLGVPAVLGIMRHLGRQVLAEPQPRLVNAQLREEEVRARNEVAQGLVVHNALCERKDECLFGMIVLKDLNVLSVSNLREERCVER